VFIPTLVSPVVGSVLETDETMEDFEFKFGDDTGKNKGEMIVEEQGR
jgi:hypothetical protein